MLRALLASTFIVFAIAKLPMNDLIMPEEDIAINPDHEVGELIEARHQECALASRTVEIGKSHNVNVKEVHLDASHKFLQCPRRINRDNWLNPEKYPDTFDLEQAQTENGLTLKVSRTDTSSGWGMPLRISCCDEDPSKVNLMLLKRVDKLQDEMQAVQDEMQAVRAENDELKRSMHSMKDQMKGLGKSSGSQSSHMAQHQAFHQRAVAASRTTVHLHKFDARLVALEERMVLVMQVSTGPSGPFGLLQIQATQGDCPLAKGQCISTSKLQTVNNKIQRSEQDAKAYENCMSFCDIGNKNRKEIVWANIEEYFPGAMPTRYDGEAVRRPVRCREYKPAKRELFLYNDAPARFYATKALADDAWYHKVAGSDLDLSNMCKDCSATCNHLEPKYSE